MNNYFSTTLLMTLVLGLSVMTHAQTGYAQTGHNKAHQGKTTAPCSNPQQPASLRCAPAPSAEFDREGRLWIAWSYGGHVYVSRSDDLGKSLKQSVVVNRVPEAISARGENRPKIVLDRSGKIYISWTTPLAKRYTGNVRFSYSDDGGRHFADPITVNDNLDLTGHRFEALAVNKQGTVFMAWLDKRDRFKARKKGEKYHGAALYYSYSADGGKSFSSNQNIMPHSCECCRVVMDIDSDQLPVVMWRNIYGRNTRDHSLVKFIDKDTPGGVIRVSHDDWKIDACPHHGPAISIAKPETAGNSDYHLVWFNNGPQRHGIFYARMTDPNIDKLSATPPLAIGNYDKAAAHADVLSLGNKVWIVWKEFDGQQESIWLQYSTDRGEHWNSPGIIAQSQHGSDYPFLLNDQDQVYLQWQTREHGFQLLPVN